MAKDNNSDIPTGKVWPMVPIVLLIWLLLIIIDLLLWCYFHSNWYLLWTAKYYY